MLMFGGQKTKNNQVTADVHNKKINYVQVFEKKMLSQYQ